MFLTDTDLMLAQLQIDNQNFAMMIEAENKAEIDRRKALKRLRLKLFKRAYDKAQTEYTPVYS